MLADVSHLAVSPVDPVAQTQDWGVVRNKNNQVRSWPRAIGVQSLSDQLPTLFAKFFSLRVGKKYSDWKFLAERFFPSVKSEIASSGDGLLSMNPI